MERAAYGLDLIKRLQSVHKNAIGRQEESGRQMKEYYDRNHKDVKFEVGDLVLVYTPAFRKQAGLLQAKFSGPWEVTKRHTELTYSVRDCKTRKTQKVNVKHMILYKPACLWEEKGNRRDTARERLPGNVPSNRERSSPESLGRQVSASTALNTSLNITARARE